MDFFQPRHVGVQLLDLFDEFLVASFCDVTLVVLFKPELVETFLVRFDFYYLNQLGHL